MFFYRNSDDVRNAELINRDVAGPSYAELKRNLDKHKNINKAELLAI